MRADIGEIARQEPVDRRPFHHGLFPLCRAVDPPLRIVGRCQAREVAASADIHRLDRARIGRALAGRIIGEGRIRIGEASGERQFVDRASLQIHFKTLNPAVTGVRHDEADLGHRIKRRVLEIMQQHAEQVDVQDQPVSEQRGFDADFVVHRAFGIEGNLRVRILRPRIVAAGLVAGAGRDIRHHALGDVVLRAQLPSQPMLRPLQIIQLQFLEQRVAEDRRLHR